MDICIATTGVAAITAATPPTPAAISMPCATPGDSSVGGVGGARGRVRVADVDAVRLEVGVAVADCGVPLRVTAEPVAMPLSENPRVSVADGDGTESDNVRVHVSVALFMSECDSDADVEAVLVGAVRTVSLPLRDREAGKVPDLEGVRADTLAAPERVAE
jgi:hypothetical protein